MTTHTEFRIESKPPKGRFWEYLPATMTVAKDRETAEKYLQRQREMASNPDWQFRIVTREVTTTATDWTPLDDS